MYSAKSLAYASLGAGVAGALLAGGGALLATGLLAREAIRARRRMDFRNKVVLITGGSRGLGLEMARQFAREGARVAICARDAEELDRAKAELERLGGEVFAVPCDVTSRQDAENMVESVIGTMGRLDVLVNNAGVISVGPLESMTVEDFEVAIRTHLWAPIYTSLAAIPQMRAQGAGRIVNISSIGGKVAVPHLVPYSASKFGLVGLSHGLRGELLKDNIYVTTICPGLMRTGSPRNADFKGRHQLEYAWFSVSDSLPGLTLSAQSAARRVVQAARFGEAEVVLGLPAKVAERFYSLFPSASTELSHFANKLLPSPGGIGTRKAKGHESESAVSRSFLTALTRKAEAEQNQRAG